MEAARIAALAEHEVTLWECATELGGVLNIAGSGQGRADLFAMRDWLVDAVDRAGVRVETNQEASVDAVTAIGADAVILATGARHVAGNLSGISPTDVVTALSAPRHSWRAAKVAVWDETGSWASLSVAETLAAAGAEVDIILRPTAAFWSVTLYSRMTAMDRLDRAGVAIRVGYTPRSYEKGELRCLNAGTGKVETLGPYSHVVHAALPEAATDFQANLEAQGLSVHVIGDAVAPRTLLEAMYDAHVAARAI